jgi:hypothetical protein
MYYRRNCTQLVTWFAVCWKSAILREKLYAAINTICKVDRQDIVRRDACGWHHMAARKRHADFSQIGGSCRRLAGVEKPVFSSGRRSLAAAAPASLCRRIKTPDISVYGGSNPQRTPWTPAEQVHRHRRLTATLGKYAVSPRYKPFDAYIQKKCKIIKATAHPYIDGTRLYAMPAQAIFNGLSDELPRSFSHDLWRNGLRGRS